MKNIILISILVFISIQTITGQDIDRKIVFPDVKDYKTLKCDFHIHTVFSDGLVWPTIRVDEAVRDGLDAIALTEHIEYQPHLDDIPHPDRNRSYEIAKQAAKAHDLIVIHGTEITRKLPPGHANAIFVTDVNKIHVDDAVASYQAARDQGAFIFWNHPNWMAQQKDGVPVLTDFHKELINKGLLHGIEVVNDLTFSAEALQLALDNGLTAIGTSDIHGLVDYQYALSEGGHRPVMLVFAKERTESAIKEALFAGRTVSWFKDLLVGNEKTLRALVEASIQTKNKGFIGDTEILQLELKNISDATFYLNNISPYTFYDQGEIIVLKPQSSILLKILSTKADRTKVPLTFSVLNAIHGLQQELSIKLDLNQE